MFRLSEGLVIHGSLAWPERTSSGTRRGREGAIDLEGVCFFLHFTKRWTL